MDLYKLHPNERQKIPYDKAHFKPFKNVHYQVIDKASDFLYKTQENFCPQAGGEIVDREIHPQVEGELADGILWKIPWGHHKYIIDKFYGQPQKALFFIRKTIENGWSRNMLLNFLDTDLYERQGKAVSNFTTTLPASQSDLAQEMTKDPYNFDFLAMTKGYREKELKDALEVNIRNFLLELGTGFAYVGREVRLVMGKTESLSICYFII